MLYSVTSGFWGVPYLIKLILKGDSFYGIALRLFYLRQIRILRNDIKYHDGIGEMSKLAFIYQNFIAINICYKLVGRRAFVFSAITLYFLYVIARMNSANYVCGMVLIGIFLTSAITIFITLERGNYQTLGLITGVIASSMWIFEKSNELLTLILMMITMLLSVSAFLIVSLVALLFTDKCSQLILGNILIVSIFVGGNFIYISRFSNSGANKKKFWNLIDALKKIFVFVAGIGRSGSIMIIRKTSILRGAVCAAPYVILAGITYSSNIFVLSLFAAVMLFLNQSKLVRLFDFHFLYWFFFALIILVFTQEANSQIIEFCWVYLIGTNPIVLYGLNKTLMSEGSRFYKIAEPVFVSKNEINVIEENARQLFSQGKHILFHDKYDSASDKNSIEYNSIFGEKALALEFFWDAIESKGSIYFPDWYGLFYSENGLKLYKKIASGEESEFKGWVGIDFSASHDFAKDAGKDSNCIFDLNNVFGLKIVSSYFNNARYIRLYSIK